MGKLLIWFGILYGNMCALVGLAAIVVWWTKQPSGQQFCENIGIGMPVCRSGLLVLDILVMGLATIMSFRRLSAVRRTLDGMRRAQTSPDRVVEKTDQRGEKK